MDAITASPDGRQPAYLAKLLLWISDGSNDARYPVLSLNSVFVLANLLTRNEFIGIEEFMIGM